MFCLKRCHFIHCLFKKRKKEKKKEEARNSAVLMALWVFFFPWTCEAGEEEDFSSFVFTEFPSQKDADSLLKRHQQPTLSMCWKSLFRNEDIQRMIKNKSNQSCGIRNQKMDQICLYSESSWWWGQNLLER